MDPQNHGPRFSAPGPFSADQLPTGSQYELVNGHPVWCSPVGLRHSTGATRGAEVLDTDPSVEAVGVEAGFALDGRNVRAPDVAITPKEGGKGWIYGAPPLAIEVADEGQDEQDLQSKISEMLARGTQYIWVVRMAGPPRVEVYTPDGVVALVRKGQALEAPGILQNPVPVAAFFDREVAHEATLRNLLNRRGFESLEAVLARGREEGKAEGKAEGTVEGAAKALRQICAARGISLDAAAEARLDACRDAAQLDRWIREAALAEAGASLRLD